MQIKKLRSHTIIPASLYVERAADAQLKQVIADMGRPGYILVSRQMGKTNLLLNAKRSLETSSDKFLYIDVSNTFPDIRQFFRNLIDIAIESHQNIDSELIQKIHSRRNLIPEQAPHKEHEAELRDILRSSPGKFVVCLDEIDALTKTQYADQVFSFIRSTYFSGRVNFQEFERLTYVLSGVAEPTELIKNKEVSPFNIGEKIYLDDFTADEFEKFIQKAELAFEDDVIERIYSWANGNPRISWDICSALEDLLIRGIHISAEDIDNLVKEMYLTNFDLPPLDHIRKLVEDDGVIRDAIVSIHYGKSESISDKVKNRLYLSGITKPNRSNGNSVSIKNRLLSESLTESWIREVERRKLSVVEIADKKFEQLQYFDAYVLYQEYLESTSNTKDHDIVYLKAGNCLYNLERYDEALALFKKSSIKKEHMPWAYFMLQSRIGVCHLLNGEHIESVECFREILAQDINNSQLFFYFDACLNLSTALFADFERNQQEILALNNLVIENEGRIREITESQTEINRVLFAAHYNRGRAYRRQGNIVFALSCIEQAIKIADMNSKVGLLAESLSLTQNQNDKNKILEQCVSVISESNLPIMLPRRESPVGFTYDVSVKLIQQVAEGNNDLLLDALVKHLLDEKIKHQVTFGSIMNQAINNLLSNGSSRATFILINSALKFSSDTPDVLNRRHLMTMGMLISQYSEIGDLSAKYLTEFIYSDNAELIDSDFRVIWGLVHAFLSSNQFDAATKLVSCTKQLLINGNYFGGREKIEGEITCGKIILDVLEFDIYSARGQSAQHVATLLDLKSRLYSISEMGLPYFSEDFLSKLRNTVSAYCFSLQTPQTIRRTERKYGANEVVVVKFKDGSLAKGKFKKFKDKINRGECHITDI